MLDWTTGKLLFIRQMIHSLPYRIKDIEFYPGSQKSFVTCGIQHMTFWKLSGDNLESYCGELTIKKIYAQNKGKEVFSHDKQLNGKFGMKLVSDEKNIAKYDLPTNKDEDLVNIFVTFLVVHYIRETLISAGDDGHLYLWDKERIIWRVQAHQGSIFALDSNVSRGHVVSGSIDGVVTLWRLQNEKRSNIKSLERLKVFDMRRDITKP